MKDLQINAKVLDGVPSNWKTILCVPQEDLDELETQQPIGPEDKELGPMSDFQKACFIVAEKQAKEYENWVKKTKEIREKILSCEDLAKIKSLDQEVADIQKKQQEIYSLFLFAKKALKKSISEDYPTVNSISICEGCILVEEKDSRISSETPAASGLLSFFVEFIMHKQ